MPTPEPDLTQLLSTVSTEAGARPVDRIVPHVYDELRSVARAALMADRRSPTLSTTALIHEAYVRLADADRVTAKGRAYFFAAAARAMRQVLVDYARRRGRLKRGGGMRALTLDTSVAGAETEPLDVLDLDRALFELAEASERAAQVVEYRFFGGMSVDEVALALDVTARTVKRDWAFARAWLFQRLGGPGAAPGPGPSGSGS